MLPLLVLLSGCWSNRPVEERALVLALGFSPGSAGQLRVTVQIPTRTGLTSLAGASGGGTVGPQVYSLSAVGPTPGAAITTLQGETQTDIYLGQVQLLVFSSRLSREQMLLTQQFLMRLAPMDKTAYVVATPSVQKFFSARTASGVIAPLTLTSGFGCHNCMTVNYQQTQWDLEMSVPTPGTSIWMPYVEPTPTGFQTDRVLVYRGLTPVWALPPKETILFGYVVGRTGKGYISFKTGGDTVGFRTIVAHPHMSATVMDGRLVLRFDLPMTGTLDTWTGPPLDPQMDQELEHQVDQYLAAHILAMLQRLQEDGSVPGNDWLAPLIWRSEPGWKNAATWEAEYQAAKLIVHVHFRLVNVGDML